MNPVVKIPFSLLSDGLTDLEKSHPFASERVGFFSFRLSSDSEIPLLICYEYHPVPDHHYVRDDTCGACIGPEAILAAMQRALASGCGQLHVHMHRRVGASAPSGIDLASGPGMSRSFANALPTMPHGWAVLSETDVAGQILFPDGKTVTVRDLAVVGHHIKTPRRFSNSTRSRGRFRRNSDRFNRQSFLGRDSQRTIEDARIGIVGLGGGGSHIVQQLAHIGFKNYVLCDMDRVEEANLNRLVEATVQDCRKKRYKIEIAARYIKKLQPDAIMTAILATGKTSFQPCAHPTSFLAVSTDTWPAGTWKRFAVAGWFPSSILAWMFTVLKKARTRFMAN
jgi:ThiF family